MNKLIIITGSSGTGKSTLGEQIYNKIENSILLSYDYFIENIYDIIGFKNIEQKRSLGALDARMYKSLIKECMKREDEVIILEKPFTKSWKSFFENLMQKYDYEVFTINMFAKDFDTIWNRLLIRENSKETRHPSHYLKSYCLRKVNDYTPQFGYKYNTLKREYTESMCNKINLGKVINVPDIEGLDIDVLVKEIMK